MANIDKELEAIQNAVYGEEVRSSIYNGIKAVNDSAVGSAQVCVTKAEEASSSAANAESSASSATTKATESEQSATMARSYATGGTGAREGEDVDNAKYYMEQAKEISQVEIATTEIAGIVKPDGNTIEVDVDGTIKIPDATKEAKGVVKLSDSEDVTDSTGLALPATEKNASIEGTLAHGIAELNSNLTDIIDVTSELQYRYCRPVSGRNKLIKCGNMMFLTVVVITTTALTNSENYIIKIPKKYLPKQSVYGAIQTNAYSMDVIPFAVSAIDDWNVWLSYQKLNNQTIPTDKWLWGTISWIIGG